MTRYLNGRSLVAAAHDALMAWLSLWLAIYLRLGEDQLYLAVDYLTVGTVIFTAICVVVFASMRLYRGLWRFASMRDMIAIARAVTLAIAMYAIVMFLLTRLDNLPRSVLFINWMLLMVMLAAPRFAYRALKDRTLSWEMSLGEKAKIPVLLVGATSLAEQFIQDMARDAATSYRVVGILDNDSSQHHRMLQRTPIYGGIEELHKVVTKLTLKRIRPHKILVASNQLSGEDISRLVELADQVAIPVARIPRLSDFRQHFGGHMQIQPIAIEDLLGRPQAVLDREAMRALVAGKNVLITGAGGSIGAELSRQIAQHDPAKLTLIDASEHNLYQIGREIAPLLQEKMEIVLGDVRDEAHMAECFIHAHPAIVFHAAALKHVPLAEANPEETVLTNVSGTRIIADLCAKHKVAQMVLISTDKAVNPSSVMGATKRIAESYCQALATQSSTAFTTVRFGNVLGSTGSVVPLFQEQIARGGPLTVTHPEMTRYFMTIREAVELVLQASALEEAREKKGPIFVLDMGKPVNITDLATQMIRLAGLTPGKEIEISYTGLRPGEKLHEELFHAAESLSSTAHASISLASPRTTDYSALAQALLRLHAASGQRRRVAVLSLLKELVPEFQPIQQTA